MTDSAPAPVNPLPENPTEADLETWALANPKRAIEFGKRLIANQDAEKLRALESLGPDEDRATTWAIANPIKTRILFMQLFSKLMAAMKQLDASPNQNSSV